jgi:serine/threonine protein kinase
MSPVSVGQIVGAKYELVRFLGRGSMGEVWIASHRGLGTDVAVKLLLPTSDDDLAEDHATAAARFHFEARIAARLSRKTRHIVRVTDHGDESGLPYLVMELLEGETLARRLLSRGTLSPGDVAAMVAQIARALREAHADGVVHRDLKPANLFLAQDEDGDLLVKVLDFGIARATRTLHTAPMRATAHGLVFGTPGYMSPEQAFAPNVDYQCDLWALATVAYEALTGDLPLAGTRCEELLANLHDRRIVPVHARNAELPQGLTPFFERAFAAPIERRFADASDLARAFEQAIGPSRARGGASTARLPEGLPSRPVAVASDLPVASMRSSRPQRAWGRLALAGPAALIAALVATALAWRAPADSLATSRSPSRSTDEPAEQAGLATAMPWQPSQDDASPAFAPLDRAPSEPDAGAPTRGAAARAVEKSHAPPVIEALHRPVSPTLASPPVPSTPAAAPPPRATVDRSAVL